MEEKERLQTIVLGNRKSKNTGRANVTLFFILTQHSQPGAGVWGNNTGSYSIKCQGESVMFLPHWPGPYCYFTFEMCLLFYRITNNLGRCPHVCQNKSPLPCACSLSQGHCPADGWLHPQEGGVPSVSGRWLSPPSIPPGFTGPWQPLSEPKSSSRSMETQPKCSCIWTSRDEWIHLCPSH